MVKTSDWAEFNIGQLFQIARPVARSAKNYDDGTIPFVASGNFNNGVERYVNAEYEQNLDRGNCITVSPLDGSAFYQECDFAGRGGAGSSILKLYNDNLNKHNALFICTILKKIGGQFNYSKMLSGDKLAKLNIKLPVAANGNPDWDFMARYVSECMQCIKKIVL